MSVAGFTGEQQDYLRRNGFEVISTLAQSHFSTNISAMTVLREEYAVQARGNGVDFSVRYRERRGRNSEDGWKPDAGESIPWETYEHPDFEWVMEAVAAMTAGVFSEPGRRDFDKSEIAEIGAFTGEDASLGEMLIPSCFHKGETYMVAVEGGYAIRSENAGYLTGVETSLKESLRNFIGCVALERIRG